MILTRCWKNSHATNSSWLGLYWMDSFEKPGFRYPQSSEIENDWAYESNCSVYALPSIQTFVGPWFKAMAGMLKPQKMERG